MLVNNYIGNLLKQCCKLLCFEENPEFLPVKFIYTIDLIENFGKLVFERIQKLS